MTRSLLTLLLLPLLSQLRAELAITEVMAKSLHATSSVNGDWWELTNTGTSAVNLDGYVWDDTPTPLEPTVSTFPNFTIQPGESIIILQEALVNVGAWRLVWGLTNSTRVLSREEFNVGIPDGESFSSFSGASGDEVNLYEPGGDLIAQVEFGESVDGLTKAFLRDGRSIYGLDSSSGKHAAYSSTPVLSDVGSPGDAGVHFTTAPTRYGTGSYNYDLSASSMTGTPTFSAGGLPSFLVLNSTGSGTATLASNRALTLADAGDYLISVTATEGGDSTIQEFLITILNPDPTVILNEYNAVANDEFLGGGTATSLDESDDLPQDSYFGRVLGNGGDWVEWVVVGDGTTGEVDLRGWSIEIGTDEGSGFFATNRIDLSDHADWSNVATGTILTFIENNTSQGGLDSAFAIRDRRNTLGDTWSNVWIGDPLRIDYTSLMVNGYTLSAGLISGIDIDNSSTQFRILNDSDEVIFGPVGEGVAPLSGTTSQEVFELERDPSPSVSPVVASSAGVQGYDDGATDSTFGEANVWTPEEDEQMVQAFVPYTTTDFVVWAAGENLVGDDALGDADPDLDGRDNFAEYAFGGDPNVRDGSYPSEQPVVGSQFSWSYVRRSNDTGLIFSHEASETLDGWAPVAAASSSTSPFAGNEDFETVIISVDLPVPTPAGWFVRAIAE
ncbi:lamin tail domain-containing protein [Haloferula sp.]|uniref:lamin tail domain-containing protein n=1 Tax=Haloferula sp. TaxID=2497595 RepID=UPI00329CD6CC